MQPATCQKCWLRRLPFPTFFALPLRIPAEWLTLFVGRPLNRLYFEPSFDSKMKEGVIGKILKCSSVWIGWRTFPKILYASNHIWLIEYLTWCQYFPDVLYIIVASFTCGRQTLGRTGQRWVGCVWLSSTTTFLWLPSPKHSLKTSWPISRYDLART